MIPPACSPASSYPESSNKRGQFLCTVVASVPLCEEHYRLVLKTGHFPPTRPGQFVQVACRDLRVHYSEEREMDWPGTMGPVFSGHELMEPLAFLRRPFSLAGRRDVADGVELEIIHRVVGIGTSWLSRLKVGDEVNVIGPQGNWFAPPAEDGVAVLVGGGVGIPPMIYLAEMLAGRRVVAFCGAVRRDLLPLTVTADAPAPTSDGFEPLYNIAEFARHGVPAVITTDDGSYGFRGFVTQALERYLEAYWGGTEARRHGGTEGGRSDEATKRRSDGGGVEGGVMGCGDDGVKEAAGCRSSLHTAYRPLPTPPKVTIYTCGPEVMMKRVVEIAVGRGMACQVSVERAMACGMGTCQSCCIKVRKADASLPPLAGSEWCYRLACTDGPVFEGRELRW